jgi:hypothetical protein
MPDSRVEHLTRWASDYDIEVVVHRDRRRVVMSRNGKSLRVKLRVRIDPGGSPFFKFKKQMYSSAKEVVEAVHRALPT